MGWMDYYRLLETHEGDLSKASKQELKSAAKANPNDAYSARQLAEAKWKESHCKLCNRECDDEVCDQCFYSN